MILLDIIYIPHLSSLPMILLGIIQIPYLLILTMIPLIIIHIPHLLSLPMILLGIIHIPHLPSLIMILLNIIHIGLHLPLLDDIIYLLIIPIVILLLLKHTIISNIKNHVIHLSLISLVTMIMDNIMMHMAPLFLRVLLVLCLCLKVMGQGRY